MASATHLSQIEIYKVDYHHPTCEPPENSNVYRVSSCPTFATFTTLPREIRNRIFDFVWDLGQSVAPSGWSSRYMPRSMRRKRPFASVRMNAMLALLHANRQISAEAADTFYSQRKFYSAPNQLIPFLEKIGFHRHLIKDIEVLQVPEYELRFPAQTFNFLKSLDGLHSFTMKIHTGSFHRLQEHLVEAGIHKLIDRIVLTVRTEHTSTLHSTIASPPSILINEGILFTNTLTREKGGKEWKSQGVHCQVIDRTAGKVNKEGTCLVEAPSQPCNHDHHPPGWYYDTHGFLNASA